MPQNTFEFVKNLEEKRREFEYYPTHNPGVTIELLKRVEISGVVLEPCVGNKDIAKYLPGKVITNDIDTDWEADYHEDASDMFSLCYTRNEIDWCVSNPPNSLARQIAECCFLHAKVGVAILTRLSFLEPTDDRRKWLSRSADHLRYIMPLNPRPSYTANGSTDSVTSCWFIWLKSFRWSDHLDCPPFDFITDWK